MQPRLLHSSLLTAGLLLLAASAGSSALAQPARLLADISDRPLDHPNRLILPPSTVVLDGVAYFSYDDGVAGQELWRSDGTEAGTWRVRDICPGRCWGNVRGITVAGERLFFLADDGVHGEELWTSDGTAAGTRLVADITPGLAHSRPFWITAFGERVFFSADDGVHGLEPWVSDGTAAGTRLLRDVRPGGEGSHLSGAVALGDRLIFFADDGIHGREPWVTDGSPAGTELVADLRSGAEGSVGVHFTPVMFPQAVPFDGRVWFVADDGVHGRELWASDGSPSGTEMAADLAPGSAHSDPRDFVLTPTRLYFEATEPSTGREVFSTDGAVFGPVLDMTPGPFSSLPRLLASFDSELYFFTRAGEVHELWRTDGSVAGTFLVRTWPESEIGWGSVWPATVAGGQLFFAAGSGAGDRAELWRTDGTTEGTELVKDIAPGPGSSLHPFFTFALPVALRGHLFFFAAHPDSGWEPWRSDGSEAGTQLVRDLFTSPSSQESFLGIDFSSPLDADGRLYFGAMNLQSGREPWTSRGTPQSTHQVEETVVDPDGIGYVWPVAPLGTRTLLFVRGTDREELWITNQQGTAAELLMPVEWSNGFGTSFAGKAYFHGADGSGHRLWVSDGSPPNTGPLIDHAEVTWLDGFAELEDRLYFTAASPTTGDELWSTDGTPGGTGLVSDLEPGPVSSRPRRLIASGGRVFFAADTSDRGLELWATDGSRVDALPEVRPGPEPGFMDHFINNTIGNYTLVPVAGGVAFVGDDGVHGEEPWWSDGVGVMPIGDLRPGARGSEPRWLTAAGDTLYFAADDGVHGRELWRWRPGEPAAMVADLVPGPGSSVPQELAGVDGVLYFSAFTPDAGVELWKSDGTAAGTVRLQDIWPGEESSTPSRLTASGRYLFFTADDGTHGREMWSLLLPTRKPRLTLTADGTLFPGAEIVLTLRLENPPPEELPDGDGHEIELPLPALLEILEVTATSGTAGVSAPAAAGAASLGGPRLATAGATGGSIVHWNGSLPPGGAVEVVVVTRVGPSPSAAIVLQATGAFDSDGDGTNDVPLASDDPDLPGEGDPTVLALAIEIPTLEATGLLLLGALLALLALHRLRRVTA